MTQEMTVYSTMHFYPGMDIAVLDTDGAGRLRRTMYVVVSVVDETTLRVRRYTPFSLN